MPILIKCFFTVAYRQRQFPSVITDKDMQHDNIYTVNKGCKNIFPLQTSSITKITSMFASKEEKYKNVISKNNLYKLIYLATILLSN